MQGKGRALALHDGAGFVREAGFISRGMPAGRHGGRPYIIISGSR